jgi:hypothetical protein
MGQPSTGFGQLQIMNKIALRLPGLSDRNVVAALHSQSARPQLSDLQPARSSIIECENQILGEGGGIAGTLLIFGPTCVLLLVADVLDLSLAVLL